MVRRKLAALQTSQQCPPELYSFSSTCATCRRHSVHFRVGWRVKPRVSASEPPKLSPAWRKRNHDNEPTTSATIKAQEKRYIVRRLHLHFSAKVSYAQHNRPTRFRQCGKPMDLSRPLPHLIKLAANAQLGILQATNRFSQRADKLCGGWFRSASRMVG